MNQPAELTLRERSRQDKRRRIEQAAREIFSEVGFDKATTREIAKRAGIGVAALFVYAPDKAELLKSIFVSELDRISTLAQSVSPDERLVEQLIAFFKPRYELWLRDPRLSRRAMLLGFAANIECAHNERAPSVVWPKMQGAIRDLVARYKASGRIDAGTDVDLVARTLFSIYLTHVHLWIAQLQPALDDGLSSLAALFSVVCEPLETRR